MLAWQTCAELSYTHLDRGVDHVSETRSVDSILRHSMLEFTPLPGQSQHLEQILSDLTDFTCQ